MIDKIIHYIMSPDVISLIKTITAIVSTLFALLTWLQNRRFKQLTMARLWSLFKKQQNGYLMSQSVLAQYKKFHANNINNEVLEWASKSEAFDQNIFEEIMLQIFSTDNNFTLEKVEQYRKQNKISDYDKTLFELMMNQPVELNPFQKILRFFNIPL